MHLETQLRGPGDLHPAIARAASRGLHDAAQPLTVLQGLLELALMQAQTVEEYRESLTAALSEMARVTACFENVRQLVRLQQPAPDVCDFSISATVKEVRDELQTVGTRILFSPEDSGDDLVHASQGRVRQALLHLISAIVLNGEKHLQISIEPQPLAFAIRLPVTGDPNSLISSLEMTQLIAASAGAEIRCSEGSVLFALPKAAVAPSTDKKAAAAARVMSTSLLDYLPNG